VSEASFSPGGTFIEELGKLLDPEEAHFAGRFAKLLTSGYFRELLKTFAAMGSLHEEIQQILFDFGGRSAVLVKYLPIDHIVLLVKFYIVQWSTLMDVTAHMISNGFNLGIDEQDVKFAVIARNKHVLETGLKDIFRSCRKLLSMDEYRKHRNEIVHRGRIMETEVLELKSEWDNHEASKYSQMLGDSTKDEEHDTKSKELTEKNFALGSKLQSKYRTHYIETTRFIDQVVRIVACKAIGFVKSDAI
jgi:hypothetical protein